MAELGLIAALFGPLFLGLVFHGLCIRFGWLGALTRPIDGGRRLRGRPLFGANKTWRGIVAVALGAAAGYALQAAVRPAALGAPLSPAAAAVFGAAMGAAAMASELLNSLLKRQLGIAPGAAGGGLGAAFFYVLDQCDVLLGGWLVGATRVTPTAGRVAWSVLFVVVVHQAISLAGAALGMRASAR